VNLFAIHSPAFQKEIPWLHSIQIAVREEQVETQGINKKTVSGFVRRRF
jgi:hypothetical protein